MAIQIQIGNAYVATKDFKEKIQQALDLLKSKSPMGYNFLLNHVDCVKSGTASAADVGATPATIYIAQPTFMASLTWLASVLTHEAMHFSLYKLKKPHTGQVAEQICNNFQLQVLRQIGGAQDEIAHLLSQKGDHSDLNGDGVYDYRDYMMRKY